MQTLSNTYLTETQFAQIIGRMRLYQALPQGLSRGIPRLLITDSQVNNVCRGYYLNDEFGGKGGSLSMWSFHNLLHHLIIYIGGVLFTSKTVFF